MQTSVKLSYAMLRSLHRASLRSTCPTLDRRLATAKTHRKHPSRQRFADRRSAASLAFGPDTTMMKADPSPAKSDFEPAFQTRRGKVLQNCSQHSWTLTQQDIEIETHMSVSISKKCTDLKSSRSSPGPTSGSAEGVAAPLLPAPLDAGSATRREPAASRARLPSCELDT